MASNNGRYVGRYGYKKGTEDSDWWVDDEYLDDNGNLCRVSKNGYVIKSGRDHGRRAAYKHGYIMDAIDYINTNLDRFGGNRLNFNTMKEDWVQYSGWSWNKGLGIGIVRLQHRFTKKYYDLFPISLPEYALLCSRLFIGRYIDEEMLGIGRYVLEEVVLPYPYYSKHYNYVDGKPSLSSISRNSFSNKHLMMLFFGGLKCDIPDDGSKFDIRNHKVDIYNYVTNNTFEGNDYFNNSMNIYINDLEENSKNKK